MSLGVDTRFTTAYTQRITRKMQLVIRIFDTSPGRLRGHLDLVSSDVERPFLAEDCLLAKLIECLYWRKSTLKLGEAAAIYDPKRSLI